MPPTLSPRVRDFFMASTWPGNIRELRSVCRVAFALAHPHAEIEMEDLPPEFVVPLGDMGRARYDRAIPDRWARLHEALQRTNGNKSAAARLLGISRQQLYRLLDSDTKEQLQHPAVSM